MKRLRITVSGKVQGVFFRAQTEKKAKQLSVTGFVRNENDGSVYIEAQGVDEDLSEFLQWCKHGPERAEVESVNLSEIPVSEDKSFRISR